MQRVDFSERMGSILQDLRYAARQIRKAPLFAFLAAFTLALGIGATTAIFSVVNQVVLKPLPYPRSDRIVQLSEVSETGGQMQFAERNFEDLEKLNKSFSSMAMYQQGPASMVANGEGVRGTVAIVSPRFFEVLGVKPVIGRLFARDEQLGSDVPMVISYGFWQQHFAGSAAVVGSALKVDSKNAVVIGVLPPGMEFPPATDVVVPNTQEKLPSRSAHNWRAVARLRDGVTIAQARQDIGTIFRRLKTENGNYMNAVDAAGIPIQDQISGPIAPMLFLLLGASAVLLLIACANVVNLLVARMAARENELAVRVAIGAGRSRLVQQLLIESSVLALVGCGGGLALAFAGVKALVALRPVNIPGVEHVAVDWRVLVFALLVSAATAVALGLIAAWRGAHGDLRAALTNGARTMAGGGASDRVRGTLVVAQVAMTVILLVGAGLLARSFVHLMSIDPGYRTHGLVVGTVSYGSAGTRDELARRVQYYDDVIARARTIPGVTSVGAGSSMPLSPYGGDGTFLILNSVDEKIEMRDIERLFQDKARTGNAEYRLASVDYFTTMNIPLLEGRWFTEGERYTSPHVAVISASLAKTRWPAGDAIGKVIEFGNMDGDVTPITIVGIVGDVREFSLAAKPRPTFYVNYRQRPAYASQFRIIMATTAPGTVLAEARRMFRAVRPDIPVRLGTIEEMVGRSLAQQRFMLFLVGVFGSLALLLATLGVYSVISYLVAQREHELSIRVALGARSGDIVQLVLRQGLTLSLVGTVAGAAGAFVATRTLRRMLYEISPTDPLSFGAVVALICLVALAASYLPARRASRIAPMDVLRGG